MGWGLGWTCVAHPLPMVRERRASAFSCLSARITRPSEPHSHALPAEAARRLHAGLPQKTRAMATGLEDSHQRPEEYHSALRRGGMS